MAENEEELRSLLMKVKKESEKAGLKLNSKKQKTKNKKNLRLWHQSHLYMQIDGGTMETVTDFILFGSEITADCDCSYRIKRHVLLGRKAMTNLDSMLKSRNISLQTNFHIDKDTFFFFFHFSCMDVRP